MTTPIYSFTESLLNPTGRFKTLDGIFALTDDRGEPRLSRLTYTVNFDVEWCGKPCILKCFMADNDSVKQSARRISTLLSGRPADYLTTFCYHEQEMLTFDIQGNPHYHDVVLQEVPPGDPFSLYLLTRADMNDRKALKELFLSFCKMSEELYNSDFLHGNIKPTNIIVSPSSHPILINYESARVVKQNELEVLDNDNYSIATLALILYLAASEPDTYWSFNKKLGNVFLNFRKVLPALCQTAREIKNEPLYTIAQALYNGKNRMRDRKALNALLRELVETGVHPRKELLRVSGAATKFVNKQNRIADLSHYDEVGDLSDNLRRVALDLKWIYIDRNAKQAIPFSYDYAEDFMEGRAVVGIGENYGLINKGGKLILDLIFEEVRWCGEYGVLIAKHDGILTLYNRNGEPLTCEPYTYMWDFEEGLILTEKELRWGYLRKDGTVAIDFIYDDAFEFRGGKARVEKDGLKFYIDHQGNIIERIPDNE